MTAFIMPVCGPIKLVLKNIMLFLAPAQPIKAKYIIDPPNISFFWSVKPNSVSGLLKNILYYVE